MVTSLPHDHHRRQELDGVCWVRGTPAYESRVVVCGGGGGGGVCVVEGTGHVQGRGEVGDESRSSAVKGQS